MLARRCAQSGRVVDHGRYARADWRIDAGRGYRVGEERVDVRRFTHRSYRVSCGHAVDLPGQAVSRRRGYVPPDPFRVVQVLTVLAVVLVILGTIVGRALD